MDTRFEGFQNVLSCDTFAIFFQNFARFLRGKKPCHWAIESDDNRIWNLQRNLVDGAVILHPEEIMENFKDFFTG